MLIVEDVALLLTDPKSGRGPAGSSQLDLALAGGLLLDMVDAGLLRISGPGEDVRPGRVVLTGAAPTGDPLLDGGAGLLVGRRPPRPQKAVEKLQRRLAPAVYARLGERGIVRAVPHRVLGIFPTTRWPAVDPAPVASLRGGLRDVLLVGRTPTVRETALVALLHAVGQVRTVVPRGELSRRELARRARAVVESVASAAPVALTIPVVHAAVVRALAAATDTGGD